MNTHNPSSAPSYQIHCRMTQEAAALERLCQVVRVRGFRIHQMAVHTAGDHLEIALTLEGARPIAMLQAQLEKLHSVAEVCLAMPSLARPRTA
ncbi:ACT domain-containing protein [Marinobacter lutaoensis]|jgi:acetolactate synthase II small subunit|uniref:Acetolactate synthase n=1 Tax=Marinobacter lutaoensis TaxID=135739 RepID=A0A1V2DT39_9GAMM|nr:ACT domain-containing protein [Marinobacter lutaoensis]ONF43689.1 acetolactate synthase [Marinobacter lutaoensis]|tara:strand:- start:5087 stop:5365 length:279 start_codon:yes stop_codon:yes gene_type:complete